MMTKYYRQQFFSRIYILDRQQLDKYCSCVCLVRFLDLYKYIYICNIYQPHLVWYCLARVLLVILMYTCMYLGNNDPSKNTSDSGYYANLISLHSYLGLSAIVLYGCNYLMGLANFLPLFSFLGISDSFKAGILPYHVFLGTIAMFASGQVCVCAFY